MKFTRVTLGDTWLGSTTNEDPGVSGSACSPVSVVGGTPMQCLTSTQSAQGGRLLGEVDVVYRLNPSALPGRAPGKGDGFQKPSHSCGCGY